MNKKKIPSNILAQAKQKKLAEFVNIFDGIWDKLVANPESAVSVTININALIPPRKVVDEKRKNSSAKNFQGTAKGARVPNAKKSS